MRYTSAGLSSTRSTSFTGVTPAASALSHCGSVSQTSTQGGTVTFHGRVRSRVEFSQKRTVQKRLCSLWCGRNTAGHRHQEGLAVFQSDRRHISYSRERRKMEPPERQRALLLVDDNHGDARLLAECLRTLPFPHSLSIITDGDSALAFLQRRAPYAAAPTPDLVLLDIHPPK